MHTFTELQPSGEITPSAVVAACYEQDTYAVLINHLVLPPEFFDLSTGMAGELTNRLTLYSIRLACVVPDLSVQSERFQEFAREANQGTQFRFFGSRDEAVAWLERIAV